MTGQKIPLQPPVRAGQRENRWRTPVLSIALAALTFAVFGQTLSHSFIALDDSDYVYSNSMVTRGLTLKGIGWAFTSFDAENWHPLTWLSHMLDCQWYGLNPAGHHLTNVLFHAATVVLLFLALREMTGALWRSAFVAAIFAIHPLRVESVAWVAERKDVMSGLFFVLTIWAYARYARNRWSAARYGLVTLLFVLGLMCKPMLVTLPLVLLLLDFWPLRRKEPAGKLVVEKLPWLALSVASGVATLLAQTGAIHSGNSFALPLRLANAMNSCVIYLWQMIWPARLSIYYPYPHHGLPEWQIVLAGALLAGLSFFAWVQRRKMPWVLTGWLWYLIMLLPVLGLVQVGDQAHADRYTYLPGIGIGVALTWWVAEWGARWPQSRLAFGIVAIGIIGALSAGAFEQAAYWKDGETLWSRMLENATRGKAADLEQKGGLDIAMIHYNLALALRQDGNLEDAIEEYKKAVQDEPDYAAAHINLGAALLQTGKLDESISELEKALQLDSSYGQAHNNLGNAYLQKGNLPEAIAHFQKAAELEPADPWVRNNLAWILATAPQASMRNGAKAVELAARADELIGGGNPIILHTMAAALAEAGRFSEAVNKAEQALRLAQEQSNDRLAGQLQLELKLYQTGRPFHLPAQRNE